MAVSTSIRPSFTGVAVGIMVTVLLLVDVLLLFIVSFVHDAMIKSKNKPGRTGKFLVKYSFNMVLKY